MGASQSSAGGGGGTSSGDGGGGSGENKDYYAILELEPTATEVEIKKAYRVMALRHHPDKNKDDVEAANKRFHLIQAAYDVLSDEQERAWYDRHREDIINGRLDDELDDATFEDLRTGRTQPTAPTSASAGLTPRHLMRFFDPAFATELKPPQSDDTGFYGTYRRLFERLAAEEASATSLPGEPPLESIKATDFPSFGYSHTPYVHPRAEEPTVGQTPVRDFYQLWCNNFSSRKSFIWEEGYRLSEAPDRRVRRLMEKENKSMRENARREYNDAVRSLAAFIRKRDPRYKAYQTAQSRSGTVSKADAARHQAEAKQRAKEREEAAKAFKAQAWQQTVMDEVDSEFGDKDGSGDSDSEPDEDGQHDEDGEGTEPSGWDCVACDKFFRSQAAWLNHERSKKHKKEVYRLQREMREEEENLALGVDGADSAPATKKHVPLAEDIDAMGLEDYGDSDSDAGEAHQPVHTPPTAGFERTRTDPAVGSGTSTPASSKKAKKKAAKKKQRAVASLDEDGYFAERLQSLRKGADEIVVGEEETDAALATRDDTVRQDKVSVDSSPANDSQVKEQVRTALSRPRSSATPTQSGSATPDAAAHQLGRLSEPPPGSFSVFGYGSLIFKPPPHTIGRTVGFIKGFARRFAQSSIDHRGTPSRPGRVVTLISSDYWHTFAAADDAPEGDIVWGVSWTIDPAHADEVRAYLDYREKNGYTPTSTDVWGIDDDTGKETVLEKEVLVYVGLPGNEAFVGPSDLDLLAERIYSCEGPSGRNDEYLLNLAEAIRNISPRTIDTYLFSLEKKVRAIKVREEAAKSDKVSVAAGNGRLHDGEPAKRGKKGNKKKVDVGEICNVCSTSFPSRSKLFDHIRATGHAAATSDVATSQGAGGRGGRKKAGRQ